MNLKKKIIIIEMLRVKLSSLYDVEPFSNNVFRAAIISNNLN